MYLLFDKLEWFSEYKIPRLPSQVPSPELLRQTWRQASVGHTIVQFPVLMLLYHAMVHYGMDIDAPLPSTWTLYGQMLAALLFLDFSFYWSHRLFHHPFLYRFHKQHHSYVGTVGFAAEYAHPVEQVRMCSCMGVSVRLRV